MFKQIVSDTNKVELTLYDCIFNVSLKPNN